MIRKVPVKNLVPGMYIADIPVNWFAHPFWRTRFKIRHAAEIERLVEAGIPEVLIDTRRGLDVPDRRPTPPRQQSLEEIDRRLVEVAAKVRADARDNVSLAEERWRARHLHEDAMTTVQGLMEDAKEGRRLDLGRTAPVVERMMESVLRHPDALIPLLNLKRHETYQYEHSLSVAALTISLGATLKFAENDLIQLAQGALLQDVGKARISERILNKATPLTDLEYLHIRSHVDRSREILEDTPGVTDLMYETVSQHHERIDGTGYPHRLAGQAVSPHAQVAAIVDVYDALTADRPYHRRLEPAAALGQLYALAGTQFRTDLVQAFVKTLGVYPVGSLVRLDNGYLAVVVEQHRDNLLKPVVRAIYNTRTRQFIQPFQLDLARRLEAPAIVGVESYAQ